MNLIFISHAEADADVALTVALELEKTGYDTWSYEVDSLPGPSYLLQTGDAVERAAVVLVVISSTSLSSHQCTREVVRGLETGKPFVPLLRDVSHTEFQTRQPEWRTAVGAATSIQVPDGDVRTIVPRIVAGLEALKVVAGPSSDAARLAQIENVLRTLPDSASAVPERASTATGRGQQSAPEKPAATDLAVEKRAPPRRLSSIAAAVLVAVLGVSAWWYLESERANGTPVEPESLFVASNAGDEVPVEVLRDRLLVLHDLKGHYVAVVPYWDKQKTDDHYLFSGDAKSLYAQRVRGGSRSGRESFSYSVWDPRFHHAGFEFRNDIYRIQCGATDRILAVVAKSEAAAVLASKFYKPKWKHHAYALAKNQQSEYVYVDKLLQKDEFRVFTGTTGAFKQLDVVSNNVDSTGVTLGIGDRFLVVTFANREVDKMTWSNAGTSAPLSVLPLWPNRELIYRGMGLYPKLLGTMCDGV